MGLYKLFTQKLLKQGYRYHKLHKTLLVLLICYLNSMYGLRWVFTLFGAILANSNLYKKDHFQRNTNQSYVSIQRVFILQYTQAII